MNGIFATIDAVDWDMIHAHNALLNLNLCNQPRRYSRNSLLYLHNGGYPASNAKGKHLNFVPLPRI